MVIVGADAVGFTFAYPLAQHGLSDKIVLTDVNSDDGLKCLLDKGLNENLDLLKFSVCRCF